MRLFSAPPSTNTSPSEGKQRAPSASGQLSGLSSSYGEALGYLRRSHELRPSKKATYFAGLCSQKLGQRDAAAEWLQACLDLESSGAADAELDRQAKAALG